MELRQWAISILSATSIEDKLYSPPSLSDHNPGSAKSWDTPSRPQGMHFRPHARKNDKLPAFHKHEKKDNRAVCLHRFAGHELLAIEFMAYTLLAFPKAPKHFRKGVASTIKDEQRHLSLYMKRLKEMGLAFGDLPLFKHFWAYTKHLKSPLHYVSVMNLTFEMANLDFAPMYGASFERFGDKKSAQLMQTILEDEIQHVRFGWHWLQRLKQKDLSPWDAWRQSSTQFLTPKRARGFIIHREPRIQAGIPEDWIEKIQSFKNP